jgi:hypothetical protein
MRLLPLKLKIRKDTLNLSAVQINDLKFRDRFTRKQHATSNVENSKKAQQSKNCSSFTTEYDDYNQKLYFDFKKNLQKIIQSEYYWSIN